MKVLSVIEAFCQGGAQTVLTDVSLWLTEFQHRVVHFSRANAIESETSFVNALEAAGIACLDVHWGALQSDSQRAKLLDGFHPDVVLFHWWGSDPWMPWLNSRQGHRPAFVCVLHHEGIPAKPGYDHYVLVSRHQLPQVAHIPAHKVTVIPNGVDLARFTFSDRGPNRDFTVGRLSEMREGKISPEWIHTLAAYRLEHTRYVIAGDGRLLANLRRDARDLQLSDRVSFPGFIPRCEVPSLLRTFDVFCYTTSSAVECCPLVIIEAMAAGLPVVAEARGGIPEIVAHNENGLLAGSLEEIGQHLHRLRDDETLRKRLGRGARATAERLSLKNQVAAYRELLTRLQPEALS